MFFVTNPFMCDGFNSSAQLINFDEIFVLDTDDLAIEKVTYDYLYGCVKRRWTFQMYIWRMVNSYLIIR